MTDADEHPGFAPLSACDEAAAATGARRSPQPADVTGICLCGGKSRRMGRDKADIEVEGVALLARAVRALGTIAGRVVLASGTREREHAGLECALDELADAGPLAGLAAGLAAATTPWVACAPCDLPYADGRVWQVLLERAAHDDLDICRYAGPRGLEPAVLVAHKRVLPVVRAALAAGARKLLSIDDYALSTEPGRPLAIGVVSERELAARWPAVAALDPTTNVNTPADLARLGCAAAAVPRSASGAPNAGGLS